MTTPLLTEIKHVLFTFNDGTHLVVRTTLNTTLAPNMVQGHIYDLDKKMNIPLEEFKDTKIEYFDTYPEEYREESEFYGKLRYGV